MSSDFWVITSYFNPARFETKRRNFDAFMAGMQKAGANVLVVESAFGDDPFEHRIQVAERRDSGRENPRVVFRISHVADVSLHSTTVTAQPSCSGYWGSQRRTSRSPEPSSSAHGTVVFTSGSR